MIDTVALREQCARDPWGMHAPSETVALCDEIERLRREVARYRTAWLSAQRRARDEAKCAESWLVLWREDLDRLGAQLAEVRAIRDEWARTPHRDRRTHAARRKTATSLRNSRLIDEVRRLRTNLTDFEVAFNKMAEAAEAHSRDLHKARAALARVEALCDQWDDLPSHVRRDIYAFDVICEVRAALAGDDRD